MIAPIIVNWKPIDRFHLWSPPRLWGTTKTYNLYLGALKALTISTLHRALILCMIWSMRSKANCANILPTAVYLSPGAIEETTTISLMAEDLVLHPGTSLVGPVINNYTHY